MDFPKVTNFKLQKKLTQSICYTSYEAQDKTKSESCVLKILNSAAAKDEILAQEFLRHGQILMGLENENICKVQSYQYDAENGLYYLKTEKHDLQPLSAIILDKFSLSLEDLLDIFIQICDTLRYANLFGVLHGMLNPNSIYINSDGRIKIDDFGFNWYIPTLLKQETKESVYLAQYIAPDYYQDMVTVDGRSDIYSIGLLLYEVIAGKAAISGASIEAITTGHLSVPLRAIDFKSLELPVEIASIISKASNKGKAQRYPNFKQIIEDLTRIKYKYVASPQHVVAPSYGSEETIIDEEHPPEYKGIIPDFLSKRIIYSGAGAVLFVFLIFFVTNYIPLGHKDENGFEHNDLAAGQIVQTDEMIASLPEKKPQDKPVTPPPAIKVDRESIPEKKAVRRVETKKEPEFAPLPTTVSATIQVKSGNLPLQADIFIENKYMGKTEANGKIRIADLDPDAILSLKAMKDGYEPSEKLVSLSDGLESFIFDLKPVAQDIGKIVFDAVPAADKIFVNGVLQNGSTPLTIELQAGKHVVAMVNSAFAIRHEETIELKSNQTVKVNYDFTVRQTGSVAVSLTNAFEFGFAYLYVDGKPWDGSSKTTPLEIQLPVGVHKVSVKRDGFTCSPEEQVINIESNKTKFVSFTLNRIGTN